MYLDTSTDQPRTRRIAQILLTQSLSDYNSFTTIGFGCLIESSTKPSPMGRANDQQKMQWSHDKTVDLLASLDHFLKIRRALGKIPEDQVLQYLQRSVGKSYKSTESKLHNICMRWGRKQGRTTLTNLFDFGTNCLEKLDEGVRKEVNEQLRVIDSPRKLRNNLNSLRANSSPGTAPAVSLKLQALITDL